MSDVITLSGRIVLDDSAYKNTLKADERLAVETGQTLTRTAEATTRALANFWKDYQKQQIADTRVANQQLRAMEREREQAAREAARVYKQLAREWEAAEKEAAKAVAEAHKQAQREATEAAREASQKQQALAKQLAQSHREVSQALKQGGSALSSLGDMAGGILGKIGGFFQSLVGDALSLARTILGELVRAFEALASAALKAGEIVGGVLAAAFVFTAKAGVDMHVIIDRSTLALTRIGGSAEKAGLLLAGLKQEALTSALTFAQLIPIAQRLGASYGPEGFGKIIPTIRAFGDVSATLGASVEAQERALQALQHLIAAGPNLRSIRQLSFNLPGANVEKILTDQFGTSDSKTLKEAGVTGEQIADAIVAGFTKRFGGSQIQLAHTLPIILSNFEDAFNNIAQAVTDRFMPSLTGALDRLLMLFQQVANNQPLLRALSVPFDLAAAAIEHASAALPGFVNWLQQILTRENIVNLIAAIVGHVQALADEVGRFLGIVSGGKTLGDVFTVFQQAAETAIDGVLRGWNVLVSSIKFLIDHSKELWDLFVDAMKPAQRALDALIGSMVILAGLSVGGKIAGAFKGFTGAGLGSTQAGMGDQYPDLRTVGGWMRELGYIVGLLPKPGTQGAGDIPKALFSGAEGIGRSVREGAIGSLGDLGGNIPERARRLWSDFLQQGQEAWQQGGLQRFKDAAARHATEARGVLNAALGPGRSAGQRAAPGSDLPPSMLLYGRPAAMGGAAAGRPDVSGEEDEEGVLDAKTARKSFLYGSQAWAAQLEAVKAQIDAFPKAQQAQQAVQRLVPMLKAEMADLLDSLPRVQDDTKEYYDRVKKYWSLEKEINDLTGRLTEEQDKEAKKAADATKQALKKQEEATKKAAEESRKHTRDALELSRTETSLIEARAKTLEMLFGKNDRGAARAVIPSLLAQFGRLGRSVGGETGQETEGRFLEQEGVGQRILAEAKKAGLNVRRVFAELVGLSMEEAGKPIDKQTLNLARWAGFTQKGFLEDLRRLNRTVNAGPGQAALAGAAASGGGNTFNFPIVVPPLGEVTSQERKLIHDEVDRRLDELVRMRR